MNFTGTLRTGQQIAFRAYVRAHRRIDIGHPAELTNSIVSNPQAGIMESIDRARTVPRGQDPAGRVSPAEWSARLDLAAAYRAVALYGWDDLVFTHISCRVPGSRDHFLTNPYGLLFEEISASSLVKVNLAGQQLEGSPADVNPAGFVIHSAFTKRGRTSPASSTCRPRTGSPSRVSATASCRYPSPRCTSPRGSATTHMKV